MAIAEEQLVVRSPGLAVVPGAPACRRRRPRARTRRRRALACLASLSIGVAVLHGGADGTALGSRPGAPRAVVVRAGQSLWDVAARFAPPGTDTRPYVDALLERNELSEPPPAGARIELPR